MRKIIRNALEAGGIKVVGEAETAQDAGPMIDLLRPDALTLDVDMPGVDGLEFLQRLMAIRRMPVVMFSSHTRKGAVKSVAALASGAFDCIGKPTSRHDTEPLARLVATIRAAVATSCVPRGDARAAIKAAHLGTALHGLPAFHRIVALGAGTGGVEALIRILSRFPTNCPPTLIAQQIGPSFLGALIDLVDAAVRPRVKIAEQGERIEMGHVYFAPAQDGHMTLRHGRVYMMSETDPQARQPSVDRLFESVAQEAGPRSVGAILTGMGADGAEGLLAMRKAGALTFAQSEESCAVYGMPKVARLIGAVDQPVALNRMADAVLRAATHEAAPQNEEASPFNDIPSSEDSAPPALRAIGTRY